MLILKINNKAWRERKKFKRKQPVEIIVQILIENIYCDIIKVFKQSAKITN